MIVSEEQGVFVPLIVEGTGFGLHKAEEAGCDWGGALEAVVVMPDWDEALFLATTNMRGEASEALVLRTGTEVAPSVIWAVDRAMVWLGLETLVTEDRFFKCGVTVG